MSRLLAQVRKWLGLEKEPEAKRVSEAELGRSEDEGMAPPDVETPSPHIDELRENPPRA